LKADTLPVAVAVEAPVVLAALEALGTTHVVTVPDTHQKTVMAAVAESSIPTVRAATEDDVLAICAGLWMAGKTPVALIQQLGIFASVNALRAFTHDQGVPLAILAGLYGRDVGVAAEEDGASAVRLCAPLLDALGIRWALVDRPEESGAILPGLAAAFAEQCTSVVLLGAPTA
jgi:sulfopyruvate decarboxylase TPP-binding subunit